jgi:restriction endonuclease S subunit
MIGDVCTINPKKSELINLKESIVVSFIPMANLNENAMYFETKDSKKLAEVTSSYTYFRNDDVLLAKVTPCFENGKAGIAKNLINGIGFGSSEFYVLRSNGSILPEWIYAAITTQAFREIATAQMTGTGGLQRIPRGVVESFQISLPPLEVQQKIIAEIEAEQGLVTSNHELITRFEKKIQASLARVWGNDENLAVEI